MLKNFMLLALSMAALTACKKENIQQPNEPLHAYNGNTTLFTQPLPNGKKVLCIKFRSYNGNTTIGGISCNWNDVH